MANDRGKEFRDNIKLKPKKTVFESLGLVKKETSVFGPSKKTPQNTEANQGCGPSFIMIGIMIVILILTYRYEGKRTQFFEYVEQGNLEKVREQVRINPDFASIEKFTGGKSSRATGITPLHIAARCGHVEIARLLAENGASVNKKEVATGRTPLHLTAFAPEPNCVEVAKILRRKNAKLLSKDKQKQTPLDLARMENKQILIAYYTSELEKIEKRKAIDRERKVHKSRRNREIHTGRPK